MGQVYHSLGNAAEAIAQYTRVKKQFIDAAEAIEYFNRKQIALPEVTTVIPGKPVEVELAFRNVATCDTKVYRIDLMKLGLLKRDLGGITRINLAGIRPQHEQTVKLGDGKDYRDRKHKLALPLKKEGAYLIVCRGDDLHASGLVLVTPLVVEVQEQTATGRVRATVKDTSKGKYVSKVDMKIIGSANREFTSGKTDLRGVFVADSIRGKSTVIAMTEGGRYAFFRGERFLGSPPQPVAKPKDKPASGTHAHGRGGKGQLLEDIFDQNEAIQQEQGQELKKVYQKGGLGGGMGGGGFGGGGIGAGAF